jgi:hypothetical protein
MLYLNNRPTFILHKEFQQKWQNSSPYRHFTNNKVIFGNRNSRSAGQEIISHLMVTEESLPRSEEPTSGLNHEHVL